MSETLLAVTIHFMDCEGNRLCMNCKKQFGIIHECSDGEVGDTERAKSNASRAGRYKQIAITGKDRRLS